MRYFPDGEGADDEPDEVWLTCPACRGGKEIGSAGGYLVSCPECDGCGEVPPCVVCGANATTEYEGEPSCGKPACEYRIQQAADYHDECGDR